MLALILTKMPKSSNVFIAEVLPRSVMQMIKSIANVRILKKLLLTSEMAECRTMPSALTSNNLKNGQNILVAEVLTVYSESAMATIQICGLE